MSSSKIFKNDPSFVRVSLLSEVNVSDEEQPEPVDETSLHVPADISPEPREEPTSLEAAEPASLEGEASPATRSGPAVLPDLDTLEKEAYQRGREEAEKEFSAGLRQALESFEQAARELEQLHGNLLDQSRGEMINLVIALCRNILGHELETSRDAIVSTLKKAVELALKDTVYELWINPEDYEVVERELPQIVESVQTLEHIHLKTDPSIQRGGCRLDSSACTVDATIEAQLETAREYLEKSASLLDMEGLSTVPHPGSSNRNEQH